VRPAAGALGDVLTGIEANGPLAVSRNRLEAEWGPLIGTPADAVVLERLNERLTCVWQEAGYPLARVRLEPMGGGRYRLAVEEGRVARVEIQGGTEAERDFVRRAFGGVGPDRTFDRNALHRGLALAQAYGVWGVEPVLHGDVLVLKVQPAKPWVFASVQNLSGETVGRWSTGVTVGLHGITPLYESTQIGVFHGLFDDRQRGVQLSSDALLTHGGLGAHLDVSWFQEKPDETPPNLDVVGTTRLARFELDHPVRSTGESLARVKAGIEVVNQDTRLAAAGTPTLRDRLRVGYVGADFEGRKGDTRWRVDLAVRQGLDGLGASRAGDPLLSRPDADPQATVVRGSARLIHQLGKAELELRARGQWSGDALLAFEEFTYGGFEGGRGLDPSAIQGDRGIAVAAEFRRQGPNILGGTLQGFGFLEAAKAWNEDAFGAREARALFAGGGLRLSYPNRLNIEASYAVPLSTENVPDRLAGPRFLIVVTKGFGG
jgi:hemolysin activation/secretion protein